MIGTLIALAAAQAAPAAAACAPGVYLESAAGRTPLAEVAAEKRKLAGLGSAMFLGGRLKIRTVIPGTSAATRVERARPTFRLCFAATAAETGSDYVGTSSGAASPADYRLVRLTSAGDHREIEVARAGGFGSTGSTVSNSAVAIDAVSDGPNQYRVTPRVDLTPGEYGFLHISAANIQSTRKKDVNETVHDFTVTAR